jgi:hypothetical protein
MGIFGKVRLSLGEIEARLKRPLAGNPTSGERGLLAALNAERLDEVQRLLDRDPTLGADFKDVVNGFLERAAHARTAFRGWRVQLPFAVWREYARESQASRMPLSDCLAAAIERDYERRLQSRDPMEALTTEVQAFHAAALHVVEEIRQLGICAADVRGLVQRVRRLEEVSARGEPLG